MDGHFVPNISWGMPVIESLRKSTKGFLDVHLMVSDPMKWVEPMKKSGADCFTFHLESMANPAATRALIAKVRELKMKVCIAIKPKTPAEALEPFIPLIDMALVMTVEPGFGGQKFMEDMMPKVAHLRAKYPELDIQVDGGLALGNVGIAAA